MPTTDPDLLAWSLRTFGPVATIFAVFILGLLRKWWVIGWQYVECEARVAKADERTEKWQAMALTATGLAEVSVGLKKP